MIGYIIVDGVINLTLGGKTFQIHPSAVNYEIVKDGLLNKASEEELLGLMRVEEAIVSYTNGEVEIKKNGVYFKDKLVDNVVATRILDFLKNGLPFEPLVNFLKKLKQNPSFNSQQETYKFLERCQLHITEDGDFLAYKGVREDWMDIYKGKFDNSIGNTVEMPREDVDDDVRKLCSYGFHVGTIDYADNYKGDGRLLLVKVNPADVVSVNGDGNANKLRTCRYKVMQEVDSQLTKPLYTNDAKQYNEDDEDDDWVDNLYYDNY